MSSYSGVRSYMTVEIRIGMKYLRLYQEKIHFSMVADTAAMKVTAASSTTPSPLALPRPHRCTAAFAGPVYSPRPSPRPQSTPRNGNKLQPRERERERGREI